jgi:hypothetical protein
MLVDVATHPYVLSMQAWLSTLYLRTPYLVQVLFTTVVCVPGTATVPGTQYQVLCEDDALTWLYVPGMMPVLSGTRYIQATPKYDIYL